MLENWESLKLPGNPSALSYSILDVPKGRARDRGRQIAFWFPDDSKVPIVVTKWAVSQQFSTFITQEHAHASWLYNDKDCKCIPMPFGAPIINGFPTLIEEFIAGSCLANKIIADPSCSTYQRAFKLSGQLLTMIQDPLSYVNKKEIVFELEPYIKRTSDVLGWDVEKKNKINCIIQEGIPDPIPGSGEVLLIGDFAPQNIIIIEDIDKTFLIDLEFSRKSFMAFLDPLSFIYKIFRIATNISVVTEPKTAIQKFQENIIDAKSPLGKDAYNFIVSRHISLKHILWYWLVFFIHEIAFQHFLCEEFSPQIKEYFNNQILNLVRQIKSYR